jgi:hypothetical protein
VSVYFAREVGGDAVKIGYSNRPESRLAQLCLMHKRDLAIIRCVNGGPLTERWFHERFRNEHIDREWFIFHEDMLTVEPSQDICGEKYDLTNFSYDFLMEQIRMRGKSISFICRASNVEKSIISRWKNGPRPSGKTLNSVWDVMQRLPVICT